jgi:hypothetical protein
MEAITNMVDLILVGMAVLMAGHLLGVAVLLEGTEQQHLAIGE